MISDTPVPHPVVLVLSDISLRSALAAQLSAAGEDVVIVGDPADLRLHPAWRESGVLVLEDFALLNNELELRGSGLHPAIWPGWLLIIGGPIARRSGSRVAFVNADNAATAILSQLRAWRLPDGV